jgi:ABC-2 type transport system ATP-binding protein
VITGLIYPQAGTARVNGHDIWNDPVGVKRSLGYLPESTPLYEEMGVVDFLRFTAEARSIPKKDARARVDEMIETCALQEMAFKDISELSRGYRQRVGLAQALIHDPPALILDEPTSGLDPTQILEIRKLVRRLGQHKAILFSTHILDEAQKTCDRILIINDGRLVGEGNPQELAAMAKGSSLYRVEFRGETQQLLSGLPGHVTVAAQQELPDGWLALDLSSTEPDDRSEELFDAVVAAGGKLRRLARKEATLEEVFLHLTKGGEA